MKVSPIVILIDKLCQRGMKKEHLHYDSWAKDITPSQGLHKMVS